MMLFIVMAIMMDGIDVVIMAVTPSECKHNFH
jgi:hypothetical protein